MDLGRLFRFGTATVDSSRARYSFSSGHRSRWPPPCISFRPIALGGQQIGPNPLRTREHTPLNLPFLFRVFPSDHCFAFSFSRQRNYRPPCQPGVKIQVRSDWLAHWAENIQLTMSLLSFFHLSFLAVFSLRLDQSFTHFFSPSLLDTSPFLAPFLAAGKKTWSTSFVHGFLFAPSVRPIKGKVLPRKQPGQLLRPCFLRFPAETRSWGSCHS